LRYAIISDIHGNLEAFEAVLKGLKGERYDLLLCLGDLVGYGPNPNECCQLMRETGGIVIAGNHDWAAVEKTGIEYFNTFARMAIRWTSEVLDEENRAYLSGLPLRWTEMGLLLVHSSPSEPSLWNYILSPQEACQEFRTFSERVCLIGHSHQPIVFSQQGENCQQNGFDGLKLKPNLRYIINVGSVGQPRDGDPRAAACIYDSKRNSVELRRYSYDVNRTQEKMAKVKLPVYLADRLSLGR